jgi:hypothetical protein
MNFYREGFMVKDLRLSWVDGLNISSAFIEDAIRRALH